MCHVPGGSMRNAPSRVIMMQLTTLRSQYDHGRTGITDLRITIDEISPDQRYRSFGHERAQHLRAGRLLASIWQLISPNASTSRSARSSAPSQTLSRLRLLL